MWCAACIEPEEKQMDTKYKTLFAALLLGLSGQAEATPVNVDVTLTVDNVYAIYSGNETDIYDFHGSATNIESGRDLRHKRCLWPSRRSILVTRH